MYYIDIIHQVMKKNTIKNICLVRGPIIYEEGAFNNEATPPIGLAYLAGYLISKNLSVSIIDSIGEGLDKRNKLEKYAGFYSHGLSDIEIMQRIPKDTDLIGFQAMFSGEWPPNRDLLLKIKKNFPKAIIVLGGEHSSALPEFIFKDCPVVDYIIHGEGERSFFNLIDGLNNKVKSENINGVSFLNSEKKYTLGNSKDRIKDLDEIPWPHWPEGMLERYWTAGKSHGVLTERDMPMIASRGCPYQCTFCSNPQMWTTRYILRDPYEVIKEIKFYKEKYNITSVQFYDLTAITKKSWILEFTKELLKQKFKIFWSLPAGTRSEVLDNETLDLVKRSGCHYLVYAPESGSQRTLDKVKKRITIQKITESMYIAKKVGLTLRANLILGFPGEKRVDVIKTIIYGWKISFNGIDEVAYFLFSAYPGSEIFNNLLKDRKVFLNDDYFLELTSLNGKFNTLDPKTYNESMSSKELAIYRTVGMSIAYLLGYIRYPKRIFRTISNVFFKKKTASTVLEHRLKDAFNKAQ